MNKARAILICNQCGKAYDPNDEKWQCQTDRKNGVGSYFVHQCDKHRISFNYPDELTYKHKSFADRVKSAIQGNG